MQKTTKPSFKKVLPYALVVFFGYVGFSLPLPILPEMFLDAEVGILPKALPENIKMLLLGMVMAAYPFGQLIGAPILGKFSDRFGRKKVVLLSLIGAMGGYITTALGASAANIAGIFLGLFFCGLCEGNIAIAQSVVSDLSPEGEEKHKVSSFGWINLFTCFAFIVGPLIGGILSDRSVVSWFSFATPFWIAAGMTLVGIVIILAFSKETRKKEENELKLGYWKSFAEGMKNQKLRKIYLVNFFLALGYFSYFRFFPVYAEGKFSLSSSMLGYIIAYGSIVFAIFTTLLLKPVAKYMSSRTAVAVFAALLAFSVFFVFIPDTILGLFLSIIPINFSLPIVMTYAAILVSSATTSAFHGQAFGMLTTVQVFAEVVTGLFGGFVAGEMRGLPMIIGSCMLLIASFILFVFIKPGKTKC